MNIMELQKRLLISRETVNDQRPHYDINRFQKNGNLFQYKKIKTI